jgi:hypothetical protein
MKNIFILCSVFLLTAFQIKAQSDSVFCLTKPDLIILVNKIQLLKDSVAYKRSIIGAQDNLIQAHNERALVYKEQIYNRQSTINTLENENKQLRDAVEFLKPKWYDNKWLWFGGGVVSTVIAIILVK